MSLYVEVKINSEAVAVVTATRITDFGSQPDSVNTYEWKWASCDRIEATGCVEHRYGDGAFSLACKVLAAADARRRHRAAEHVATFGECESELWRDLQAEVERLREIIDRVIVVAEEAAGAGWRDVPSQTVDEADGRNAVGNAIFAAIEGRDRLRPKMIKTIAQLDALPDRVVVIDRTGTVWEKDNQPAGADEPWWAPGTAFGLGSDQIALPARVIHMPESS